jgi:hypothetical protein
MSAPSPVSCKSCGRKIFWSTTEPNGRVMPVDSEPDPNGKFILNQRGRELIAIHVSNVLPEALAGRRLWTSHFSTCPHAAQHRSPR